MLAKINRLSKEKEFARLLKLGKTYFSNCLIIKVYPNNLNNSRFGFIISKKIAKKAVIRNKIKRRLREIIRKDLKILKDGYDVAIITKKEANLPKMNFQQLKEGVNNLEKKANLFKNS